MGFLVVKLSIWVSQDWSLMFLGLFCPDIFFCLSWFILLSCFPHASGTQLSVSIHCSSRILSLYYNPLASEFSICCPPDWHLMGLSTLHFLVWKGKRTILKTMPVVPNSVLPWQPVLFLLFTPSALLPASIPFIQIDLPHQGHKHTHGRIQANLHVCSSPFLVIQWTVSSPVITQAFLPFLWFWVFIKNYLILPPEFPVFTGPCGTETKGLTH